jgi:peptidyl-prolyl cis-trans isomerase D
MLEQIRKQAQSSIIILLFGFIIFVFIFSFGAGSEGFRAGGCGQQNVVAMVNGEPVTEETYRFAYNNMLRNTLANRGERGLKREEKLALRQRALEELIEQSLLVQAGRAAGLRVSNEERNADIKSSAMFKGDGDRFDLKRYKAIVQRYFETTPTVFEEVWRQQMLAQRMANVIQEATRVTDEELEQSYLMRETKINVEFVRLSAGLFRKGAPNPEAEVEAFLKDNLARVEAAYRERDALYNKPKKVQIAHVFFEVPEGSDEALIRDRHERAELTHEDLAKGAELAAQAKDYSHDEATREKGGELPLGTRDELTARWGAPLAEAAFGLPEGGLSQVVRSDKGFHVFKVSKIVEAEVKPLAEVQHELARELLLEARAEDAARAEAERLFAAMKAGQTLEELLPQAEASPGEEPSAEPRPQARKTGLTARMQGYLPQLGLDRDLARAAFALTPERPYPDKVYELPSPFGGKEFVVFRLIERAEPDLALFAEAKESLRQQLLQGRKSAQLRAWLDDHRARARVKVNESMVVDLSPQALRPRASAPLPTDNY